MNPKIIPSLDDVIVKFLEKYEVYVKPASTSKRNIKNDAIAGAITGMAGADVGGDAFMISGQNKQTAVQEWTQWKQWALDHKDFESFRKNMIDHAKEFNKNIEITLQDPVFQKEIEPLIKKFEDEKIQKEKAEVAANNTLGIIFVILFALFAGALFYEDYKTKQKQKKYSNLQINLIETRNNDSSFNNSIIRNEKITKFIS